MGHGAGEGTSTNFLMGMARMCFLGLFRLPKELYQALGFRDLALEQVLGKQVAYNRSSKSLQGVWGLGFRLRFLQVLYSKFTCIALLRSIYPRMTAE